MNVTEAAEKGDVPALRALLEAGADPNEWDADGLTALTLAMDRTLEGEGSEAARVLLAHGADVNRANDGGSTPLSHAAFLCNLELVQLFLDSGADVNIQMETGETALFGIGCYVDSSPAARIETLRLLLAHGANPNIVNEEGACVLSYAAVRGHMDAVKLLLEAGADPNLCDGSRDTPLMCGRRTERTRQ